MGTLRVEPRKTQILEEAEYKHYLNILRQAQASASEHHVFYDLDANEEPAKEKRSLNYVAERENIEVTIRHPRGKRTLTIHFSKSRSSGTRMPADESKSRILNALKGSDQPMKKHDIIKATGISPSTWNIRIRELVKGKHVVRHGERRDTTYSFGKPLS